VIQDSLVPQCISRSQISEILSDRIHQQESHYLDRYRSDSDRRRPLGSNLCRTGSL